MTNRVSFNEHERDLIPAYRAMIDSAESTEDVRKFFERTAAKFLERALGDAMDVGQGGVLFDPEAEEGFRLGEELAQSEQFAVVVAGSDLGHILGRLAQRALRRWQHLERKRPDKTEAKMFPIPGRR